MNRRNLYLALSICMLAAPALSYGHSFGLISGNLASANSCGFGIGYLGVYGNLGHETNSLFGSISYGFSDYTEGRAKLGFADARHLDSDLRLFFGVDFKYQFMDYNSQTSKQPLDMAFGGLFEFADLGPVSVTELGGNLIGSIPYKLRSGQKITPYGRVDLRVERISNGGSDTDFEAGLNLGVKYEMSPDMYVYGEFQFDGNTALFVGLDFRAF